MKSGSTNRGYVGVGRHLVDVARGSRNAVFACRIEDVPGGSIVAAGDKDRCTLGGGLFEDRIKRLRVERRRSAAVPETDAHDAANILTYNFLPRVEDAALAGAQVVTLRRLRLDCMRPFNIQQGFGFVTVLPRVGSGRQNNRRYSVRQSKLRVELVDSGLQEVGVADDRDTGCPGAVRYRQFVIKRTKIGRAKSRLAVDRHPWPSVTRAREGFAERRVKRHWHGLTHIVQPIDRADNSRKF